MKFGIAKLQKKFTKTSKKGLNARKIKKKQQQRIKLNRG